LNGTVILSLLKLSILSLAITTSTTSVYGDDLADCSQTEDISRKISGCTELLRRPQLRAIAEAAVYSSRGTAYLRDNRADLAQDDFDHSIRLNPNDWRPYFGRGELRELQHKQDAAAKDYDRAEQITEADPKPAEVDIVKRLRDWLEKYERYSYDKLAARWEKYLQEIQSDGDYANWSGKPYDLYLSHHNFPTRYELLNRLLLWVFPLKFLDWSYEKGWLSLSAVTVGTVLFLSFVAYFVRRLALAWLRLVPTPIPAEEPRFNPIPLTAADLAHYEPDKSTPPRGHAPEPAFGGTPGSDRRESHPTLAQLRLRALNQLFDHFGLNMIPAQAWTALDRVGDPVAAFRQLATWVGCDPELVRRKDAAQLVRMETASAC
jgi:tetratricopeptide (TPR) repeat protein